MKNRWLRDTNQGSILLVMVILMALLAGFALTFIKAPNKLPQIRHDRNALATADQQLRSFMAFNGRLPCPDTTGDGRENCGAASSKGNLPYLTLGLKESGYGAGDVALRYGLYRRADNTEVKHDSPFGPTGAVDFLSPLGSWDPLGWFTYTVTTYAKDADLGVLKNRYEPTTADGLQMNTANQNTVDLCLALRNGAKVGIDSNYTYVHSTAIGTYNVAYAIAAAGYGDDDNQNGLFDGLNGSSAVGFNSPDMPISVNYDDQVLSRSFTDLQNDMQCDVVINSLNLMADAVHSQLDVSSQSAGIKVATIVGAGLAGTAVVINIYDFVLTVAGAAAATTALTAATAAEATAIAACTVVIGCPEVPIMGAAVAAAVAAEAASDGAAIASAAAVVAQVAATAAYATIAVAANIVLPATDKMDLSSSINTMTQSLNKAKADLAAAKTAAASLRAKATQDFTDADNTLTSISTYAKAHDDPSATTDPEVIAKAQAVFDAKDAEDAAKKTYDAKAATWQPLQKQCDAIANPGGTAAQCAAADNDWQAKKQSCYAISPPDPDAQVCKDMKTAWNTRLSMCGNPGTGTECADAASAKSEADQAKVNLDAKSALVAAAENDAKIAADDYLVYDSGNKKCSIVANCNLPTLVQQAIDQYTTAIKDDATASAKEKEVTNLTQQVSDLTNSLAVLNCMQLDKFYDSTNKTCVDQPSPGSTSGISFATGAGSILKQADSLGTTQ